MAHDYKNYGKDRNRTGTSKKNLLGGGYTHYDFRGKKTGTSRENLFGGGYTHYDARGRKTGSSSQHIFGSGYTHYDARGRKTGSSNGNIFGGGYTHYDAHGHKTGRSSEGCYIATCVYGSYDCPEVLVLRNFRDTVLKKSLPGRAFIQVYYAISPKLVRWFGKTGWFCKFWRGFLDRVIERIGRAE